ncbi:hypothetical protein HOLleu_35318 [Holothuria leucospilota]|uniref:HECT domain-containing protein n=1 Tax=Holothuria leucospilota TaxID=206669 RepID=A0A9Q0YR98_HOLLE|nr:hypothetical protein HOLleu_35318 [Holothuria leucospilota]
MTDLMTDDQLKRYLLFAGDGLFIRQHCSTVTEAQSSSSGDVFKMHKKTKLIEKLRTKLKKEQGMNQVTRTIMARAKCWVIKMQQKKTGKFKLAGFTILTKGSVDDFDVSLLDVAKQEVPPNETVFQMYDKHKLPLLRLYIGTKPKLVQSSAISIKSDSSLDEDDSLDCCFVDPFQLDVSQAGASPASANHDVDAEVQPDVDNLIDLSHDVVAYEVEIPNTADKGQPEGYVSSLSGTPTVQFPVIAQSDDDNDDTIPVCETQEIVVRRSNLFEDFISVFSEKEIMDRKLDVRIVETNGEIEKGEGDGVFRDAVTEFWSMFCRVSNGDVYKVPVIRHDFDSDRWESIARIFVKGWKDTGYFPIIIAPAFMEECIFGSHSNADILHSFMLYVSSFERDVLEGALKGFPDDTDELLDILSGYDCKKIPRSGEFKSLLQEIAHKELIQKPMFVINSWRPVASHMSQDLDRKSLSALYRDLSPNVKGVIALLKTDSCINSTETTVFGYLKKFIRSLNQNDLKLFLRFCTGSDLLTCNLISVTFNQSDGFTRSPIAHTCTCTLEIPVTYETFTDLKNDFTQILRSNVWIMDLK